MRTLSIFLILLFFLTSCSRVVDVQRIELSKKFTYAVIPFENYTDTPLAGYRIASILEGVMRAKGFRVINRVWEYRETEPTRQELKKYFEEALKRADFVVFGTVNEFRYKTGIDGEPAVSISVYVYDKASGKVIKGASASASGWAHESLGTVAQKLLRKVIK